MLAGTTPVEPIGQHRWLAFALPVNPYTVQPKIATVVAVGLRRLDFK